MRHLTLPGGAAGCARQPVQDGEALVLPEREGGVAVLHGGVVHENHHQLHEIHLGAPERHLPVWIHRERVIRRGVDGVGAVQHAPSRNAEFSGSLVM